MDDFEMLNKIILISSIIFHYIVLIGFVLTMLLSFTVLQWYIALTLCSLIVRVIFSRNECPLTSFENIYRTKLGLIKSTGFLKDYILNINETYSYLKTELLGES